MITIRKDEHTGLICINRETCGGRPVNPLELTVSECIELVRSLQELFPETRTNHSSLNLSTKEYCFTLCQSNGAISVFNLSREVCEMLYESIEEVLHTSKSRQRKEEAKKIIKLEETLKLYKQWYEEDAKTRFELEKKCDILKKKLSACDGAVTPVESTKSMHNNLVTKEGIRVVLNIINNSRCTAMEKDIIDGLATLNLQFKE